MQVHKKRLLAVGALVATSALVLSACGGDDDPASGGSTDNL
jgi:hypothetical protein